MVRLLNPIKVDLANLTENKHCNVHEHFSLNKSALVPNNELQIFRTLRASATVRRLNALLECTSCS